MIKKDYLRVWICLCIVFVGILRFLIFRQEKPLQESLTWLEKSILDSTAAEIKEKNLPPYLSFWSKCTKKPTSQYRRGRDFLMNEQWIALASWSLKEVLTGYSFYTNDKNWTAELLPLAFITESKSDFKSFRSGWYDDVGETKNYWYLYTDIPVEKRGLQDFIPLQFLGVQAVDNFVGYSSWYLVWFPYKLPVDAETFTASYDSTFRPDLPNDRWWFRWKNFINNWIQYDKYLWDDKDRVYFWDKNESYIQYYALNRVKKASDFCFYKNPDPESDEWY